MEKSLITKQLHDLKLDVYGNYYPDEHFAILTNVLIRLIDLVIKIQETKAELYVDDQR